MFVNAFITNSIYSLQCYGIFCLRIHKIFEQSTWVSIFGYVVSLQFHLFAFALITGTWFSLISSYVKCHFESQVMMNSKYCHRFPGKTAIKRTYQNTINHLMEMSSRISIFLQPQILRVNKELVVVLFEIY